MTKIKGFFQPLILPNSASLGILIVRLLLGVAFVLHGWGKIQSPFSWMPAAAPVPGFLQFLAAISEFGGGIAWIIGFLTPLASLGIAFTMAVATYTHAIVMKNPYIDAAGGASYERALIYLGVALLFILAGAGKYSIDAKVFGEKR